MFTLSSGEKHTRESGEMVCNLEHVGALQIVVPTNARETRPETCGALPIRGLNTSVPRIIIVFGRYAFETGLVRCGPAPAGLKHEMTCSLALLAMGGSRPLRSYLALKRERVGWITSGKASIRHLPLPFGTPLTGCYIVCTDFRSSWESSASSSVTRARASPSSASIAVTSGALIATVVLQMEHSNVRVYRSIGPNVTSVRVIGTWHFGQRGEASEGVLGSISLTLDMLPLPCR